MNGIKIRGFQQSKIFEMKQIFTDMKLQLSAGFSK